MDFPIVSCHFTLWQFNIAIENHIKSPFLMGKSTINGPFSIAVCMFTRGYQRIASIPVSCSRSASRWSWPRCAPPRAAPRVRRPRPGQRPGRWKRRPGRRCKNLMILMETEVIIGFWMVMKNGDEKWWWVVYYWYIMCILFVIIVGGCWWWMVMNMVIIRVISCILVVYYVYMICYYSWWMLVMNGD